MRVSIIVPAYNAGGTLTQCLRACLNQSWPDTEVILVDDGSTDGTAERAQQFAVRYLHQSNQGPAAARNRGAREATGEIVAFTDSDCIPERDWIKGLIAGFRDDTVAVGGTYGIADDSTFLARAVHEEIALRHERFGDEVDFLGSFNVAYRKVAFDAVGGFDESFRIASGEDNDLAYRLQDAGGTLRFVADARVNHYHPTRLAPYLRTQMRHGFWRMKLYAKHPDRGRGDHYAGFVEFAGPPLSLLLVASLAALLFARAMPQLDEAVLYGLAASFLAFLAVYVVLGARTVPKIARRCTDDPSLKCVLQRYLLRFYLFARDVARGIGLVRGVWTFLILRKETA